MRDSRTYRAYPSNIDILDAFRKLEGHLSKGNFTEDRESYCSNINYELHPSAKRRLEAGDFKEFMELLGQFPHSMPVAIHGHFVSNKKDKVACIVLVTRSELSVTIESNDLNIMSAFHDRLKDFFQASNPIENQSKPVSRHGLKKTIFLAHRFDQQGKDLSIRLQTFLSRLGFQVLEGSGYEARDIPDKVMDKIRTQDIFICIVTPGDPSWILSEASTANAIGKYLIIICQTGIEFNRGIIGRDYEYLEFPKDNIEKVYSDLLSALPS